MREYARSGLRGEKMSEEPKNTVNPREETDYVEQRKYARAPFRTKVSIASSPEGPWIEAEVLDISFGGAHVRFQFIEGEIDISEGASCVVKFRAKDKEKAYQGNIAWVSQKTSSGEVPVVEAGINFGELPLEKKNEILRIFMWTKLQENLEGEN